MGTRTENRLFSNVINNINMYVHVCVCVCVRACACARVRVCMRARDNKCIESGAKQSAALLMKKPRLNISVSPIPAHATQVLNLDKAAYHRIRIRTRIYPPTHTRARARTWAHIMGPIHGYP